jgi:hypothetical protein
MFFHRGKRMFQFLKNQALALGCVSTLLVGCSAGLDGGSITGVFGGITSATVEGPETVVINWQTNLNCTNYQVFILSSSTSSPITTASIPPVTLKAPNVASDHTYNFAVGCVDATNTVSGEGISQTVTTMSEFNGILTSSLDLTGTNPIVNLNWNYPTGQGVFYEIYATPSVVPGDLSTWMLAEPNGTGTAYAGTPICTVYDTNSATLGIGGTCPTTALTSGLTYNFKVVAKYPDHTYSVDLEGNGTTIAVPASFTPPNCVLTQTGIGSDPTSAALILRCQSGGAATGACSVANVSTTAYQAINGVKTPVSNTLVGPGTLRISPTISSSATNTRQVQNLEIDYVCNSNGVTTTSIVRYDGSNPAFPQPSLKFGSSGYEAAPPPAYAAHPSYLGGSFAIGDFDCDGSPDIAVGLPKVSYNQAPYLNQLPESGAVKIYYDYAITATGGISAARTEYLSFRDLPAYAHFGQSLSAGNINKDVHVVNAPNGTKQVYGCDDLIIGAPGSPTQSGNGSYRGQAFIFYGQPQGFPQPLDAAGLATNAPTCSGSISSEVCSPVKLQPDMPTYFHINPGFTNQNGIGGYGSPDQLGFSVAYIRDFNADGYGDIAIGNPYCRWDGEGINNQTNPSTGAPTNLPPTDVGCVYVYWGGPQGLQNTVVGETPDATQPLSSAPSSQILNAPFVKIYPPIPQSGMHFGWSIGGGGDVDGGLPVPVPQNSGAGTILANGNDFVVGAPDYRYLSGTDQNAGQSKVPSWTVDETVAIQNCAGGTGGSCPVDPVVLQGPASYTTPNFTGNMISPPWNGAWTQTPATWTGSGIPNPSATHCGGASCGNLASSTGIAFLYRGRSALENYNISLTSAAAGVFQLFPNQAATPPTDTTMSQLLSNSLQARRNGSQYLKVLNTTWAQSPTSSFYNCGTRGGPTASSGGMFKHISCLAGRNNFSVLYPTSAISGAAVSQFGKNVAIAGASEQNAVALYQLGPLVSASAYAQTNDPNGNFDLTPFAQGGTSASIRGTSLWELGVSGLTTPGTSSNCETSSDMSSTAARTITQGCLTANYTGTLARSIIDESYSFSTQWNAIPAATPISDINRDGYADVLITSNNQLYTFFGNFAADFSYQGSAYSSSATCSVTRNATLSSNLFSNSHGNTWASKSPLYSSGNYPVPFSTVLARSSAIYNASAMPSPTSDYQITGEYPEFILPDTNHNVRGAYLDDLTELGTITFDYPTGMTRSGAGSACLPQVRTYSNVPTALAVADLNGDGILDAITGFSATNASNGLTVISSSATGGYGLASDNNITVGTSGTELGSAVAAANWKFIDDSTRRDLFSGALGYANGAGAVYSFSAAGNATLSAAPSYQFTENSNAPNLLSFERSKIIGDLNGDGYDDIWVPVKQIDSSGNVYYDAMIYYGSAIGPITYMNCVANASKITLLSGGGISSADCAGSATPQIATFQGTQITLPQYVAKPTGVSNTWALFPFSAGDVNRDGFQDVIIFDALGSTTNPSNIYLFFGSGSGLVNGQPFMGASLNLSPQLVTQNAQIAGNFSAFQSNAGFPPGAPSWANNPNSQNWPGTPQTQRPIVHGDFNGDGYQDIAFGVYYGHSSNHATDFAGDNGDGAWSCPVGQGAYGNTCVTTPPVAQGSVYDAQSSPGVPFNGALTGAGYIVVLYGSAGGYQTPTGPSGSAVDFATINETCTDFFNSCTGLNTSQLREVYNTLTYNNSTQSYQLDGTKAACIPEVGGATANTSYSCTGTLIRDPFFYNDQVIGGEVLSLVNLGFGNSLSVADTNNDGIDDLIVGSSNSSHISWGGLISAGKTTNTIFGQTSDQSGKGMAFIYYGAKGVGLVAPRSDLMLGDAGMGLVGSTQLPNANAPVFQLYPEYPGISQSPTFPELDRNGNSNDQGRMFGMGMTTGDFNGDGIDDVAIVSGNGQIYIYYGPLCALDNSVTAMNQMYENHNQACLTNTTGVPGSCGTSTSALSQTNCTLFNLNATFSSSVATNTVTTGPASAKPLFPQMIYVPGSSKASGMGSTLLSKRPTRSPATITELKNPGNIDGDPENTSDLVIGTNAMSDPNVPSGGTGLGYIYFGHKAQSGSSMSSLPGIYASGVANYNANLISTTISGTNYYFYSPVLLKPHTSDGVTGGFFNFETSFGDVNGDGTADLLMPTQDINIGAEGTSNPNSASVISGGGFKLFY